MKKVITYMKEIVNVRTKTRRTIKVTSSHGFDALGDHYGKYEEKVIEEEKIKTGEENNG